MSQTLAQQIGDNWGGGGFIYSYSQTVKTADLKEINKTAHKYTNIRPQLTCGTSGPRQHIELKTESYISSLYTFPYPLSFVVDK